MSARLKQDALNNNKKGLFEILSLELLIISSLFILSLFAFGLIAHEVVYEKERWVDDAIFSFFSSFSGNGFIETMKFFTFFGSSQFLLPAYIILITYFIIKKMFRYSIHIAMISISSTALMLVIKEITHRQRPDSPVIIGITTFSFPSGHTLSSFIFCSILIYIIWRGNLKPLFRWIYSILLFSFAVTIGISRIVLKVHYPTDVIAALCLGFAWVVLSFWILTNMSKKSALKNLEQVEIAD